MCTRDRDRCNIPEIISSLQHFMLSCQRHLFQLPEDVHFLNCAYVAPLPRAVEDAGIDGMRKKRNPADIRPEDFFEDSDRVRRLFARLIGADAGSIALVPSVSYGIAAAAHNVAVARGQNIIVMHEQFPSNVYAWRRLAAERGAEMRTVEPDGTRERRAASWNERILDAIDADTAIVAMPNVHWADGTRFDLESIGRRAREVGAALVVDGTQSVGALPFDIGTIQPDVLVCAGYKWMFGPYGSALAYFSESMHEGVPLEENWIARRNSERFSGLVDYEDRYQPGAIRYDVGERSNFILLPMMAAALELVLEWTPEAIQEYCRALTIELAREARDLGYQIEREDGRGAHLFGIRLPQGMAAERLREELDAHGVAVSVRGSAVRISPHVYNDAADVDALQDALAAAAKKPA